jgi:hypothetical protein
MKPLGASDNQHRCVRSKLRFFAIDATTGTLSSESEAELLRIRMRLLSRQTGSGVASLWTGVPVIRFVSISTSDFGSRTQLAHYSQNDGAHGINDGERLGRIDITIFEHLRSAAGHRPVRRRVSSRASRGVGQASRRAGRIHQLTRHEVQADPAR